jgi:hypothetical protein
MIYDHTSSYALPWVELRRLGYQVELCAYETVVGEEWPCRNYKTRKIEQAQQTLISHKNHQQSNLQKCFEVFSFITYHNGMY